MEKQSNRRTVQDAIWANPLTGNTIRRMEAMRRGETSALIQLAVRIGP
jgi:hypothetical protein